MYGCHFVWLSSSMRIFRTKLSFEDNKKKLNEKSKRKWYIGTIMKKKLRKTEENGRKPNLKRKKKNIYVELSWIRSYHYLISGGRLFSFFIHVYEYFFII